jgi:hypothetical protein
MVPEEEGNAVLSLAASLKSAQLGNNSLHQSTGSHFVHPRFEFSIEISIVFVQFDR